MSLPAGYVLWCQSVGLNPWHPDEWTPEALDAFRAWQRDARARPPSRPYRSCPCHPFAPVGPDDPREVEERVSDPAVAFWVARDPLVRAGLARRTQVALAWLEETFAR